MGNNKVIGSNGQELRTDVLLHPGEVLEMELIARGLTKSKFAMDIKMYPLALFLSPTGLFSEPLLRDLDLISRLDKCSGPLLSESI